MIAVPVNAANTARLAESGRQRFQFDTTAPSVVTVSKSTDRRNFRIREIICPHNPRNEKANSVLTIADRRITRGSRDFYGGRDKSPSDAQMGAKRESDLTFRR
jgi:hypothetical protein